MKQIFKRSQRSETSSTGILDEESKKKNSGQKEEQKKKIVENNNKNGQQVDQKRQQPEQQQQQQQSQQQQLSQEQISGQQNSLEQNYQSTQQQQQQQRLPQDSQQQLCNVEQQVQHVMHERLQSNELQYQKQKDKCKNSSSMTSYEQSIGLSQNERQGQEQSPDNNLSPDLNSDHRQQMQRRKEQQLRQLDQLLGLQYQLADDKSTVVSQSTKCNPVTETIIMKSTVIEKQIKTDGIGTSKKSDTSTTVENSRSQTPSIVDQKVKEWNTKMAEISSNNGVTQESGDSDSALKSLKPQKIEDYEPGHSSIARLTGAVDEEYNPPVEKPGANCRYTASDSEAEYRIRKLDRPFSPALSDVHELYKSVQRGGLIPQEGIKIPQEIRRGHTLSHVASHYYNPHACTSESRGSTMTRQERDLENIIRKKRVEQAITEEKKKRQMQTERDKLARRHCDYFCPSQKSLVPLNRYEDEDSYMNSNTTSLQRPKLGPKVRGKARALYNFRAQNSRELSFRRGDYIYLLRQVDHNWFKGERHGIVGIFPIKYVEVITSITEAQNQAREGEGLARALYNFSAQTSLELSLRKGDVVKLIRRVDDNWYEGRLGNSRACGIFPVLYVETLVDPTTPYMTPACSRAVTPMIGSPGYVSPTSSLYSVGPAPTIPSAPMSPAESEIFDESQFLSSDWCSSPNRWTANNRPASAASRHYNPRELLKDDSRGGSCYYSSSGLDGIGFDTRPAIRASRSFGPTIRTQGFAKNIKNIMSAYQFDEREENGHQGTNLNSKNFSLNDAKDVQSQSKSTKNDYSDLRYPPYRALYSYTPRRNDELQLRAGDIIFVVERGTDGWFVGTSDRTKEFGTFPGNYVQQLK